MPVKTKILPVKTKGSNQLNHCTYYCASIAQCLALSACIKCFYFESLVAKEFCWICCQAPGCSRLPISIVILLIFWGNKCCVYHLVTWGKPQVQFADVKKWSCVKISHTVYKISVSRPANGTSCPKSKLKSIWPFLAKVRQNSPLGRFLKVSLFT